MFRLARGAPTCRRGQIKSSLGDLLHASGAANERSFIKAAPGARAGRAEGGRAAGRPNWPRQSARGLASHQANERTIVMFRAPPAGAEAPENKSAKGQVIVATLRNMRQLVRTGGFVHCLEFLAIGV